MKKRALLVGLVVAIAIVAVWHPDSPVAPAVMTPASEPSPARKHRRGESGGSPIAAVVYVVGAVRRPGLYRISVSARADDAVRAAGGLRPNADAEGINLAAYVHDGDEVLVPVVGQAVGSTAQRRTRTTRTRGRKSVVPPAPVDLNSADATALATLPGIGPTLAARIVAVRERDGPYASTDQLLDVAGMTQSRLDRVASYLRI